MVDLLSEPGSPDVALLVTAGSQAPYLYLLDALEHLRPERSENRPFTPWLNIYDRRDLLSFCAERVFTGVQGIRDVAIDSGVPFPAAHSAYWESAELWAALREAWPQ